MNLPHAALYAALCALGVCAFVAPETTAWLVRRVWS